MAAPLGSTNRANGKRFANAIKAALEEYEDDKVKRGEALRAIATGLVKDAVNGDAYARRELADRLDGKPAQSTELSGPDGGPIVTQGLAPIYGLQPPN
jgi:hypothetical protein